MKRLAHIAAAAVLAAPVLAFAQAPDPVAILAEMRRALGGDKLNEVRTLAIEGTSTTVTGGGARTTELEMAVQLPDKFMRREVIAAMGNMSVYRVSGFNGPDGLINEVDRPPQLAGGGRMVFGYGPSNPMAVGVELTPEQREEQRQALLESVRRDYARLALGLFGAAPAVYPLEFAYAGEAESPDGKAHVLDVKGEGGFAARLFVDVTTHRPLMLTWMDKEPIQMTMGGSGVQMQAGAGMSAADRERMMQEAQARLKEAEANRRVVEFQLFYGDFKTVGGVTLPHRFQYSIDGNPSREIAFERVRLNQRIDQRKFQVSK
jgi:hypothetical protein